VIQLVLQIVLMGKQAEQSAGWCSLIPQCPGLPAQLENVMPAMVLKKSG